MGRRVLSTACIVCETCTSVCPREALSLTFGFDLGGREMLVERATEEPQESNAVT